MSVEGTNTTAAVETAAERVPENQVPVAPRADTVAPEERTRAEAPSEPVDSDDDAPRRGRPAVGNDRTKRTAQSKWSKARTDTAKREALVFARRNSVLRGLTGDAIAWGLEHGVLTERQAAIARGMEPRAEAEPARVPQAPTPVQQSATGSVPTTPQGGTNAQAPAQATVPPGAAPPAAPPPTPAPPAPPNYMGQPLERVTMFAGLALPVLQAVGERFKSEAFDPTKHAHGVLFRGSPIETKVDAVPVERMAELIGVKCAQRWPASGGADPASQATTELVVLGLAAFGPALLTAGKRAMGALVGLGRGLGRRVKGRRGAGDVAEVDA